MGFSKTINPLTGRWALACDFCGRAPARKIPCPFGWCQSYAMCAECRAKPENHGAAYKEAHRLKGCEKYAAEARLKDARAAAVLERGGFIIRAASQMDAKPGRVLLSAKNYREEWVSVTADRSEYDEYRARCWSNNQPLALEGIAHVVEAVTPQKNKEVKI